jgi:hypothetical protein
LGTLDFTAAVTSLDGAQGERVHAPWRLRLSTGPKASGCMSMSRSDVDKATPRVTRVEALSRVSPGFPPRAITCAGASTVVPLVHSPLVSPLSDTPIPHPVPSPPPAPGRVRVALGPVSACGGPPRGPAFSGPTCTTGAYRERAISKKHIAHFLGHHSRFRVPRNHARNSNCGDWSATNPCAPRVVSPRDLWVCVLPRWQLNVNGLQK